MANTTLHEGSTRNSGGQQLAERSHNSKRLAQIMGGDGDEFFEPCAGQVQLPLQFPAALGFRLERLS